jgi:MinD-like ATPase involved in chromosome partitioning or flagellar assembly
MSVPFLGSIPIDPEICRDSDNGIPFITEHADSPATKAFSEIVKKIQRFLENPMLLREMTVEREK